jgi:hypothetical protein
VILFKALFVFGPLLYSPIEGRWNKLQKRIIQILFAAWLIFIVFTPFSFRGWTIDYVIFFCVFTMALATLPLYTRQRWATAIRIVAAAAVLIYCVVALKFGGSLVEEYDRDGLTYHLYKIPDMVAAPTYTLNIDERYGLFEKRVFEKTVQPSPCKFDYIPQADRLIVTDSCSQAERSKTIQH